MTPHDARRMMGMLLASRVGEDRRFILVYKRKRCPRRMAVWGWWPGWYGNPGQRDERAPRVDLGHLVPA